METLKHLFIRALKYFVLCLFEAKMQSILIFLMADTSLPELSAGHPFTGLILMVYGIPLLINILWALIFANGAVYKKLKCALGSTLIYLIILHLGDYIHYYEFQYGSYLLWSVLFVVQLIFWEVLNNKKYIALNKTS